MFLPIHLSKFDNLRSRLNLLRMIWNRSSKNQTVKRENFIGRSLPLTPIKLHQKTKMMSVILI